MSIYEDLAVKLGLALLAGLVVAGFVLLRWVPLSGGKLWLISVIGAGVALALVWSLRQEPQTGRPIPAYQLAIVAALAGGVWTMITVRVANAVFDTTSPVRMGAVVKKFVDVRNPNAVLTLDSGDELSVHVGREVPGRLHIRDRLELQVWPGALGVPYVVRGEVLAAIERVLSGR